MDPNGYRDHWQSNSSSPFVPMFPSDTNLNYQNTFTNPNMYHPQPHPPPFPQHHSQPIFHYPHHLPNQNNPQYNQSSQPLPQHQPLPHLDLAQTLTQLAEGQRELFETMQTLNAKIDSTGRAPITSIDQLASNLGDINLNRQAPPHQSNHDSNVRPTYIAKPPVPSRISSPSEGAFARESHQRVLFKEPKPR